MKKLGFCIAAIVMLFTVNSAFACGHGGFVSQSAFYPQTVFVQSYPFVPLTFASNAVAVQTAPVFVNSGFNNGFVNVQANTRNGGFVNVQANAGANVRVRNSVFGNRTVVRVNNR